MPRTVNLISRDNGVGLTVDMALLKGMLTEAGYTVRTLDWESKRMPVCDVAVFLELINPKLFRYAGALVGVLNLEWMPDAWSPLLERFDQLWAKSDLAHEEFLARGLTNSHLTGFLGRDLYRPDVVRELRCLHLRGKSDTKSTPEVIEAWRRHPNLPPLTIVCHEPEKVLGHIRVPDYVEVLPLHYGEDLPQLMNACAIHVCPSRSDGWGHYVAEAMSTGNMVVTTDVSPMNVHVPPGLGYHLPAGRPRPLMSGVQWDVDPLDIAEAVRCAELAFPGDIAEFGERRRAHLKARNEEFRSTALGLLEKLGESA